MNIVNELMNAPSIIPISGTYTVFLVLNFEIIRINKALTDNEQTKDNIVLPINDSVLKITIAKTRPNCAPSSVAAVSGETNLFLLIC